MNIIAAQNRGWWLAIVLALVATATTCKPTTAPVASRPLAVIVSCDTAGWIVPCGCSSKQAGGLLRRATYARQVAAAADVLLADAGGAPGGASPYDRLKFEFVLRGEVEMRVAAHNIGAAEAELGAEFLRDVAAKTKAPLVSSNVRDERGEPIAATHRMAMVGSRRIAVLGVLSPKFACGGLKVDEPHEAVFRTIATLKGQYDSLLVLAYLPEDELEAFVPRVPEADLVVGGPIRQSIAPRRAGPTVWAAATSKGKFLVHLERASKSGAAWDGKVVELGPEFADDAVQTKNLERFRDELARIDFAADQTGFSPPLPADLPPDFRVAGTEACRKCHRDDCRHWDETKHAHAWQTLVEKKSHVDSYCQHCHTTGYGLPDGFTTLARGGERTSVGCESCHGPSLAHASRPATKTIYAARDRCVTCHDRENSPQFDYEKFWDQIVHGESANAK